MGDLISMRNFRTLRVFSLLFFRAIHVNFKPSKPRVACFYFLTRGIQISSYVKRLPESCWVLAFMVYTVLPDNVFRFFSHSSVLKHV